MAFKMNTSIGKIYAKIQGTKPHAKAIATAKAPTPATGNVQGVSNPLNQGSPLQFDKKALERMNKLSDKAASKPIEKDSDQQKIDKTSFSTKPQVSNDQAVEKKLTKKITKNKKVPVKKSYKEAYKNADKSKYKDFASFEKAAKKYNADKKGSSTPPSKITREKVKSVIEISKPKPKNIDNDLKKALKKKLSKDNKIKPETPKSEGPKSRRQLRLDRRLAKTQSKGRAIADGKGTKTPAEQRKALRLKKREGRLKKKIETKVKGSAGDKKRKASQKTVDDFKAGKYKGKDISEFIKT